MGYLIKHRQAELNTSSVADIAFLLLSFFLMTTVISDDKGLTLTLPEWRDRPVQHPVNTRNLFTIRINSMDEFLINGERRSSLVGLRKDVRMFILNFGKDQNGSDSPEAAVVSLKTDRGTTHQTFVTALNEIQAAYYEIYAERAGISIAEYLKLDPANHEDRTVINSAKRGFPLNVSLTEPDKSVP